MEYSTDHTGNYSDISAIHTNRVGFFSALLTALMTVITFGFAIVAVPASGANCLAGCYHYPYLDTLPQYPKDYRWMVLAMIFILFYVIFMAAIHHYVPGEKKIFSQIGLIFASFASLVLLTDYFLQFSIVPVSLMSGETEGITLLTQYNAHGIFIVLEELGYLLMSISFLFFGLGIPPRSRPENAARWVYFISFGLAVAALIAFSVIYGLDRQDRFEVTIISITWLALIVNGTLFSIIFRRKLKAA